MSGIKYSMVTCASSALASITLLLPFELMAHGLEALRKPIAVVIPPPISGLCASLVAACTKIVQACKQLHKLCQVQLGARTTVASRGRIPRLIGRIPL